MTTLDPNKVRQLLDRAGKEIDQGLLPSCQLAIAVDGEVAVEATFGDATSATSYVIFSCTKPLVASAAWLLMGEQQLDPAATVADLVPQFCSHGKEVVTVEQVMLHTGGFPYAPMPPAAWNDRRARLERFKSWRLTFEPGTRFEYHPTSAHWVLAEIIERASGQDFRGFVHDRILQPCGLADRVHLGVEPAEVETQRVTIAPLAPVGDPATPDELEAIAGIREMPTTEVNEHTLVEFNRPDARRAGVPGGGGVSTASGLALFYQALLHDRSGVWNPEILADATSHVRCTLTDPMMGVPCNRTLGLVVAGDDGHAQLRHNFGRTVSPRAFGHAGAGGQIAWADPATGISFAYLTNGLDRNILREARRGIALSSRAAVTADDSR